MKKSLAHLSAAGLMAAISGAAPQALAMETAARQVAPKTSPASKFNAGTFILQRMLQALRRLDGGSAGNPRGGYRNRAGWTNARYRRHALKLRNRARHRRACRG
jgi:hypothetical protein